MHWQDDLDHKAAEELVQERAAAAGKVMGWDYHMCHLYCSFISVLSKYPQCRSILNAAREMFEGLYGAGALDALTPWMTCNFASLPKKDKNLPKRTAPCVGPFFWVFSPNIVLYPKSLDPFNHLYMPSYI